MNYTLLEKADKLEKANQDKSKLPRYHVIRKPDGRIVRVDIQKAREAMRHAMILHAKQRLMNPYDQL
jgi:hypothetical protein